MVTPHLLDPECGSLTFSRHVEDTDAMLDLEERALNNYLSEVTKISSCNFVYNPSLHPSHVNMYLNPNLYTGESGNRAQQSVNGSQQQPSTNSVLGIPNPAAGQAGGQTYRPLGFERLEDVSEDEEDDDEEEDEDLEESEEDEEQEDLDDMEAEPEGQARMIPWNDRPNRSDEDEID